MKKIIEDQIFEINWAYSKVSEAELELHKRQEDLHQCKLDLKKTLQEYCTCLEKEGTTDIPFQEGKHTYKIAHRYLLVDFEEGEIRSVDPVEAIIIKIPSNDEPMAEQQPVENTQPEQL